MSIVAGAPQLRRANIAVGEFEQDSREEYY